MIEGKISKLDVEKRSAVIVTDDGAEIPVRFTDNVNVEVVELETQGWVGGELADLDEGYLVNLDISPADRDGVHSCGNIVSLS